MIKMVVKSYVFRTRKKTTKEFESYGLLVLGFKT